MEIKIDDTVREFIFSLQPAAISKVWRTIDLLKKYEYRLGMPHSRMVSEKLFELRVRGGQEIRIFYVFHKNNAHLLHIFVKKSEKTPLNEVKNAIMKQKLLTGT